MSEAASAELSSIAPAHAGRPAILIVDDNQANLVAMQALLGNLGLELAVANSGEEALRALLDQDFAVVLMDVQMPGLDGFKTTELIRQRDRSRHTPIIFVTAIFTDAESAKRAYALGALDFITKPFDEAMVKAKVAALVEHHRHLDLIGRQAEALHAKEREAYRANAAREAAEAANRAKDEFLALLSHELRAPLHSILGCVALIERDTSLSPASRKPLETLARAARTQSKLVDELLDVSAIVGERLSLDRQSVDLRTIAQSAIASMYPAAAQKNIRVDLSVGDGGFRVLGDAERLEQLLCHLLSNAVKFSDAGSAVTVELSRRGAELRLRVKDTGVGIDPQFLPLVFDRFRQADSTRTRQRGGLGIGLTIARLLAEKHGGTLEAFSAGLGTGAELVLTLAAESADATPDTAAPATAAVGDAGDPAASLGGTRILLIDDDADARDVLCELLTLSGASVVTAGSARTALAEFEAGPFDVVVSDLGMPDEDGLTLLQKIKRVDAARGGGLAAAVAVSGYGSAEDRAASRRAGFHAHLVKPADPHELVTLLARLTRSP